ncbi:hypothetical protein [Streptomyces sp. S186]|uniref:hypothetical protein n=1 Tax=Streptomyces sp. S186 TaxID=3434395 RepID=UPI003F6795AE
MSTAPQGRAPWFVQLHDRLAVAVDQKVGWQNLPKPLGLLTLVGLRDNLRRKNLFDTGSYPSYNLPEVGPPDAHAVTVTGASAATCRRTGPSPNPSRTSSPRALAR